MTETDNGTPERRGWSRRKLLTGALATGAIVPVILPSGPLPGLYNLLAGEGGAPTTVRAGNAPILPGRSVTANVMPVGYRKPAAAHPEPIEPFRDALPIPRVLRPDRDGEVVVRMRTARVRLHSQLPPTTVWGYEGTVPGPTIEVRAGQRTRVRWVNDLTGTMPLVAVAPMIAQADPPLWDRPGRDGAPELTDVSNLPAWTVVHLHGAETGMDNDGWPEAGIPRGDVQVAEYGNDQRATLLWYHDHAMPISRWNTIAGLAGLYVIRDRTEDALDLPDGRYEVPLVLCDRNFDLDANGELTGTQLYKTVMYTTEPELQATSFSGPFTTVNGVIWPHHDVEPRWYRLRIANVSNVRPYQLSLTLEDGSPVPAAMVRLIGTDGGLLPAPVTIDGVLPVAAAERADVLVNFGAVRGKRIRLSNVDYDPGPWPQVMEFRVSGRGGGGPQPPATLDRKFPKVDPAAATAPARMIMFPPLGTGQIEQWEMTEVPAPPGPFPVDGVVQVRGEDGTVRTYQRVARHFNDPVQFMATTGGWERWTWMNLDVAGWPHPQHIHATHFRVTGRQHYDVEDKWEFILDDAGRTVGGGTVAPLEFTATGELTPVEGGWKDVVQVNNGEAVTVAARFDHSGRFLHHCHMRDHEDMGMMRPFVVMPAEVLKIEHQHGHPMPQPDGHAGH
ncbi:multicopper oxidase family protein [Actinophytocola sediminis]